MNYQRRELPREAPKGIRAEILEALILHHYDIYPDSGRWLKQRGFKPTRVVQHLIDYLKDGFRLYLLIGSAIKGTKYQCCLDYEDLIIHVKLAPYRQDEPPSLTLDLSFHKHDTGGPPLPP